MRLISYISIITLLHVTPCIGQVTSTTTDYIVWSSGDKLKWEHFRGEPDSSLVTSFKAVTSVSFSVNGRLSDLKVLCLFDTKKSWTVSSGDHLLAHEQLHFDIGELVARKIRKGILLMKEEGKLDSNSVNKLLTDHYKMYNDLSDQFDQETSHGLSEESQSLWKAKVAKQLESLSMYANKTDNR